jgi:hypothetical protein
MSRALKALLLATAATGCGIVAGLGDAPVYLGADGSAGSSDPRGIGGASVTGAADSSVQGIAGMGGSAGDAIGIIGRGGDTTMATCVIGCDGGLEANSVSACRGLMCPLDAGGNPVEAGPCANPSTCNTIPDGWQAVALTAAACPSGFANPKMFYTTANADPLECSCGCAGSQACSGSVTLNEYASDGGVTCTGTPATRTIAVSPTCQTGNSGPIVRGNLYTLSNVAYAPAPACSASPTATTKPQVQAKTTFVCTASSLCPSGVCLQGSETASLCVEKDGTNACPSGYTQVQLMSATYDDTRKCDACTCGSTLTCTLKGVLLDNGSNCELGHPYLMTAGEACDPTSSVAPSDYPINAVRAETTTGGSGACAMTSPSKPSGTVALTAANTITVCCK